MPDPITVTPRRAETCIKCKFRTIEPDGIYCRRHPPVPYPFDISVENADLRAKIISTWPRVDPLNWCGEWKPFIAATAAQDAEHRGITA